MKKKNASRCYFVTAIVVAILGLEWKMEAAAVQKFSMDFLSICFSKPCQDDSKTGCVNKPIFKILHVQFSATIEVTTRLSDVLYDSGPLDLRESFLLVTVCYLYKRNCSLSGPWAFARSLRRQPFLTFVEGRH